MPSVPGAVPGADGLCRPGGKQRWLVLGVSCAVLMAAAVLYAWSIFAAHLQSRYGWSQVATAGVFTLSMCSYCAGSLLSGYLSERFAAPVRLLAAGALLLSGFCLAGLRPDAPGVYLGYGGLCGCGVGMVYNTLLGHCSQWFSDRPGLCSGILLTAYGFSTFFISAGASRLLRLCGWQGTLLAFGGFDFAALALGALALRARPPAAAGRAGSAAETGLTPGQMLRQKRFYGIFFWLIVMTASGLAAINGAGQIAAEAGFGRGAALLPGLITASGCLGRLGFGRLFDRSGPGRAAGTDSLLMAAGTCCMAAALPLRCVSLLLLGLFALGVGYGGMASLCAAIVRGTFGGRYFSRNLSVVTLQMIPSSLLGPLLGSVLYLRLGGYAAVCGVLSALSLVSAVFIRRCLPAE